MTVFRQENLEEHYDTGEDLGRWVRAGDASGLCEPFPLSAAGQGRSSCLLNLSALREPPEDGKGERELNFKPRPGSFFFFFTRARWILSWSNSQLVPFRRGAHQGVVRCLRAYLLPLGRRHSCEIVGLLLAAGRVAGNVVGL